MTHIIDREKLRAIFAEIDAEDAARDPREGKDWPPEEDCPTCDRRIGGPHRFSCATARGDAPREFYAHKDASGRIVIDGVKA